ncbi:methyl-accepting chemotaxis protein [Rheinheimera riviphila]|uniref:Methyl-accepting chemotaxis protein n=1 Tax=Rheinheimera riviphila TaxID=1834037 RepID=A0A437QF77_9GAMM|nr:methyl-accepting chemotaxis protein [Rheinheimera riviphila]RVU33190.1 methyl-accepting chemotaxis protein [Rheinheimera riviphila]
MEFLQRLSIAKKVYLIPFIGTISFIVYLVLATVTALNNVKTLESTRDIQFPVLQAAESGLVALERVKESLASAVTTGDEEALKVSDGFAEQLKKQLNQVSQLDAALREEISPILSSFDDYYSVAFKVSEEMVSNTADMATIGERSQKMNADYDSTVKKLSQFRDVQLKHFTASIDDANQQASTLITVGIVMGVFTTFVLFITAVLVVGGIKSSLLSIINSLKDLAKEDGDLTVRIQTKSKDELGDLAFWFNSFMEKLQGVVKEIVNTALPLSSLAKDLHQLTDDTNKTIAVQRQAADKAKFAVDNMSSSVIAEASSANEASSAANDSNNAADRGQQTVGVTVNNIRQLAANVQEASDVILKLETDANQVGAVLDVIKGIAEQTNLLALNAAIEAARAGEQGRGFAVVADEVRTLASRTQKSTEEIQKTIEQLQSAARSAVQKMQQSTVQADQSVNSANQAGESLQVITTSIRRIREMNQHIASATEEQQIMANTIVNHVVDIVKHTEHSSQSAGNIAKASRELANLAQNLENIARLFRV